MWVITFELSGMGGPTSSIRYRQHSSQEHVTAHAPPLRGVANTKHIKTNIDATISNWFYTLHDIITRPNGRAGIQERFVYTYLAVESF